VDDARTAIRHDTRIGRGSDGLRRTETARERDEFFGPISRRTLKLLDLVQDAFGALARDGCTVVEVQQRPANDP